MERIRQAALTVLMVFGVNILGFAQIEKDPNCAYISTYNVFSFGHLDKKYKDIEKGETPGDNEIPDRIINSAKVLAFGDFDIITLQEVKHGPAGKAAIKDLVQALKDNHDQEYNWFVSDKIGRGLFDESIAFLYKTEGVENIMVDDKTSTLIESGLPQNRKFAKTKWRIGDFDFTLISCHFSWIQGDPKRRQADYEKLNEILNNPMSFSDDPDVIVMGDFNRFGANWQSDEYGVLKLDYDPKKWRAPNVTIWDPSFKSLKQVKDANITNLNIPNDNPQFLSTTVAKNSSVYDVVFFTADVSEEFPSDHGKEKYGVDFGIFHFDEVGGIGHILGAERMRHNKLKKAYSDHRPLWIRFKVNMGTSDN